MPYPWAHGDTLVWNELNAAIAQGVGSLPLIGGTLTGPLIGTSASFSGAVAGGSVQSTGVGTVTVGSVGGNNGIQLKPFAPGTTPQINAQGPAGAVGINVQTQSGGTIGLLAATSVTGLLTGSSGIFAQPTGGTITLAGAITTAQRPFSSSLNVAGTDAVDAIVPYQFHLVNSDTAALLGTATGFGGYYQLKAQTGFRGSRIGFGSSVNLLGTSGNKAIGANTSNIALWGDMTATANDGGTALTIAGAYGSAWAGLLNTTLAVTATNYALFQGLEIDLNALGTTTRKHGLQISLGPNDLNRGAFFDAAFVLGNSTANVGNGWKYGVLLSEDSSQWVFKADSTMIGALMGQNDSVVPALADIGLDFLEPTFTTAAFRTQGMSVDPVGNVQIGAAYIQPVAGGLTVDAKGSVGNTANGAGMLVTGGSGWSGGEVLTDAYGGRYKVSSVAAGVITSLTVYRQPIFPTTTTPANPVTLGVRSGTTATPPTINISWNTTGNGITLAGATGKLGFYGHAAVAQPAAPVTLADCVAIIRGCGLSA